MATTARPYSQSAADISANVCGGVPWSNTNHCSNWSFFTTPFGSTTQTLAMQINSDQTLSLSHPLGAAYGGTGLATLTAHGVMLGEGTSNVAVAPVGTAGQILIDQGASADPSFKAASGDVASISSTGAFTFTAVNSNIGSFGSATQVPQFTVNGKGLVTAVSNVTISGVVPGGSAGGALSGTYPNPTLATAQPDVHTWALTQTFTVAPVFTDQSGSRTALGLAGANPTATAGPSAVNGSAVTYMRSDAAPAVQKGTNAVFGIVEGDGTTITCVTGICTALGAASTSIDAGGATTSVSNGTTNNLLYDLGGFVKALATANNGVLITSGAGAPSISSTLPTAVQGNITSLGTITSLTANALTVTNPANAGLLVTVSNPSNAKQLGFNFNNTSTNWSFGIDLNNNGGTDFFLYNVAGAGNFTIGLGSSNKVAITGTLDATSVSTGSLVNSGGFATNKRVWMNGLTTSSGLQTAVLCQSSAGEVIADSVACLASATKFKEGFASIDPAQVKRLTDAFVVKSWNYKREPNSVFPENYYRQRIGLIADDVAKIDPRLVEYDANGEVRTIDYNAIISILAARISNDNLEARLEKLEKMENRK